MAEKSKWFYTQFKNDTKAVILLAHGLNLSPKKMDHLAFFFNSKKCDVFRISLGDDPENWKEKFSDDYAAAAEHAEILQLPFYFVGFSLGALLGVHYLLRHQGHKFSKLALLAPATHTHFYTVIPSVLASIFPRAALPSFNLKNYRARNTTTLLEYKKVHQLQKELGNSLKENSINVATLLIIDPKDELVASSKVSKFAHSNPYWKVLEISNKDSTLIRKYHHLMIDLDALGTKEWEKVLKNLTEHFCL